MNMTVNNFLGRPWNRESDISPHRLDVNPEATLFHAADSGSTEAEYLALLSSLVGVFKPTFLMETGTWNGDGAAALISAAAPGSTVLTICHHDLDALVSEGLKRLSEEAEVSLQFYKANTIDLAEGRCDRTWAELTQAKATFAFLDSSIPDRAKEFDHISDPERGVLDFSRPLCVCVHDVSRYRHPGDADTGHLPEAVAALEGICHHRGWQCMRLNQSRGMMVMIKYPDEPRKATGKAVAVDDSSKKTALSFSDVLLTTVTVGRGNFSAIKNDNVAIYLPHGLGDWVFFSHVLPLLEPSNKYWMTRFGDDYTSLMDGSSLGAPIYLGLKSTHCGDGDDFANRHFGLNYDSIKGIEEQLRVPSSFQAACRDNNIRMLLFNNLQESWGWSGFPYHTKARANLKDLISADRLDSSSLGSPLKSCISFDVNGWESRWIEARLRSICGFGERKLCLIGRTGYTSVGKNWGHQWRDNEDGCSLPEGEECRDFMKLMLKKDPNWLFLAMEDQLFKGNDTLRSEELHCYSYAELFGTPNDPSIPFGIVIRVLANLASLSVGVPAGAHHLCMAKTELPSVGIWIEHFPSWYDEPKEASIHVISKNVHDQHLDSRPGSFTQKGNLSYTTMPLQTRRVYGEDVFAAVEALLS